MLDRPSIGAVGSRDATDAGLRFARGLGERAAHEDVVMVSGDARGIDRTAMEAALDAGGKVIGLLSDSLSKSVLSKRYRRAIGEGRVLLVSHVEPDARFTVGQAMERNRYIYAASDAVVIADSAEKGGTWNGALENAKHGWTPAYVRTGQDMRDGGHALIRQGMLELSDEWLADGKPIASLFEGRMAPADVLPLFDKSAPSRSAELPAKPADERDVLFAVFTEKLAAIIDNPLTTDAIARRFGIEINQAEKWLQRASDVGGIVTDNGEHWTAP
jgi:predicted Rossmann fold nucleotide-binding protein DprA/Smf involved in DNA uptake